MAQQQQPTSNPVKKALSRLLDSLERMELGNRAWLDSNMSFVLFISVLGMIYIANARLAEKTMSDIKNAQTDLRELRWQYLTTKADLMYGSKEKEVAKLVEPIGLKELKAPPRKMYIAGEK